MLLITDANIFMDLEKIALWMIEKLKLLKELRSIDETQKTNNSSTNSFLLRWNA